MKKDGILYTILFSFLVSFLFVFPLALANEGTADLVRRNQELARQRAILIAMNFPFQTEQEVAELYGKIQTVEREGVRLYRGTQEGRTIFAKVFSGSGVWGIIQGILSVDEAMSRTIGIHIISHSETPGLGGRIDEPWFKEQFRGLAIKDGRIRVTFGLAVGSGIANREAGIVDGITGATGTSRAMNTILNDNVQTFQRLLGGAR